ncbi:hypothetical protein HK096_000510, partial [Nowakowskiella sp. JEL0078]
MSGDLMEGTTIYNDYMIALEQMIRSIEFSSSPLVIKVLVLHLCRDGTHKMVDQLKRNIEISAQKFPADAFRSLTNYLMSLIQKTEYPVEFRKNVADMILLPCLIGSPQDNVKSFFESNISKIMQQTREEFSRKVDDLKIQLIMKSLPLKEINTDEGSVAMAYSASVPLPPSKLGKETKKGLQLTTDILRRASDSSKELTPPDDSDEILKWRLVFHQAAYCAAVAALQYTQNQ